MRSLDLQVGDKRLDLLPSKADTFQSTPSSGSPDGLGQSHVRHLLVVASCSHFVQHTGVERVRNQREVHRHQRSHFHDCLQSTGQVQVRGSRNQLDPPTSVAEMMGGLLLMTAVGVHHCQLQMSLVIIAHHRCLLLRRERSSKAVSGMLKMFCFLAMLRCQKLRSSK